MNSVNQSFFQQQSPILFQEKEDREIELNKTTAVSAERKIELFVKLFTQRLVNGTLLTLVIPDNKQRRRNQRRIETQDNNSTQDDCIIIARDSNSNEYNEEEEFQMRIGTNIELCNMNSIKHYTQIISIVALISELLKSNNFNSIFLYF
jgi:hypothetical protein